MASVTRKKRIEENQENVKTSLELIWDSNLDSTLWKISHREAKGGIHDTMNLSKEDLEDLAWREDNGNAMPLLKSDTGKIRITCLF